MRTDIRNLVFKGYPTVLSWNRLEGRPRKNSFSRSLKAEVRDPLWMLSRQWQLGEFKGNDAGSPVFSKIKMHTTKLTRYKSRKGKVVPFEKNVPLEAKVEKEQIGDTYQLSIEIARYWFKLLNKSKLTDYRDSYIQAYPFVMPSYEKYQYAIYAHKQVWQSLQALSNRYMDGYAFIKHLLAGNNAGDAISVSSGDGPLLDDAAQKLIKWYKQQYYQPHEQESQTWEPSQLEYQFACSAPRNGDRQVVLKAEEYYSGHLDWYSFMIDDTADGLHEESSVEIDDDVEQNVVLTHLPSPLEFGGMPATRWWEMEDARTDFGAVDANTTDIAKLLLVEFGLVYANDWFVVPFDLPEGTLASVQGLRITDSFGRNFWIEAAGKGAESNWERWSMYTLDKVSDTGRADTRLFIPPAIGKLMESPPLEKINLIRDEMANMVWGIESRLPLANGDSVAGVEAARETREHIRKFITPPAPPAGEDENEATIQYKIQTTVPENWIPFIPVKVNGSNREIQLRRAAMLRTLEGDSDTPRIEPRTKLLREGLDEGERYHIYEEEVPRAGAIVRRSFQRARWHNGQVYTWMGRKKTTGKGEGASGLSFDIIKPVKE